MSLSNRDLSDADVIRLVNAAVDKAGGQSAFGLLVGRKRQDINAQIHAREGRAYSADVLAAAGIERVEIFRMKDAAGV